jgi:hypothetical protein
VLTERARVAARFQTGARQPGGYIVSRRIEARRRRISSAIVVAGDHREIPGQLFGGNRIGGAAHTCRQHG